MVRLVLGLVSLAGWMVPRVCLEIDREAMLWHARPTSEISRVREAHRHTHTNIPTHLGTRQASRRDRAGGYGTVSLAADTRPTNEIPRVREAHTNIHTHLGTRQASRSAREFESSRVSVRQHSISRNVVVACCRSRVALVSLSLSAFNPHMSRVNRAYRRLFRQLLDPREIGSFATVNLEDAYSGDFGIVHGRTAGVVGGTTGAIVGGALGFGLSVAVLAAAATPTGGLAFGAAPLAAFPMYVSWS